MSMVTVEVYARSVAVLKTDPGSSGSHRFHVYGNLRWPGMLRVFRVTVRLPAGDTITPDSIFEVERPEKYNGPYDHAAFAEIIQEHLRSVVPIGTRLENIPFPPFKFDDVLIGSFEAETGNDGAW